MCLEVVSAGAVCSIKESFGPQNQRMPVVIRTSKSKLLFVGKSLFITLFVVFIKFCTLFLSKNPSFLMTSVLTLVSIDSM